MATKIISVSTTPVAVVASAVGFQVSVSPTPGSPTPVQKYNAAQVAEGGVRPVNSTVQFTTPQTGAPFFPGQVVGYISIPAGTVNFSVQDSDTALYAPPLAGGAFPSAGAIGQTSGRAFLTGAAATAYTMNPPVAGADDFKEIAIADTTGKAHTITFPANALNGTLHIATFNGTIGSTLVMRAFGGVWYVNGNTSVTLS